MENPEAILSIIVLLTVLTLALVGTVSSIILFTEAVNKRNWKEMALSSLMIIFVVVGLASLFLNF